MDASCMPELPDITVYVEALRTRLLGQPVQRVRITSLFLLRSADPPISAVEGQSVLDVRRMGKRIVLELADDLHLLLHLMVAGRLHWQEPNARIPGKTGLAAFDFPIGTLLLTEQGTKRRASLYLVRGTHALAQMERPGLEVLDASLADFRAALLRENHTLKRALTDPDLISGIGNTYSDELLHAARLSPARLTRQLTDAEMERLYHATRQTLLDWTARLRHETGERFPEKVTAFRAGMAVHGRYGQACPDCGHPVQRVLYADNEANYCATCQTGGKLLADRALSRLLKGDWPRSLEELESRKARWAAN
jgi:formamidopyrimidine-DNA glycosylase